MTRPTQPLREEHRDLLPRLEGLKSTADAVGEAAGGPLREAIDACHDFLTHMLIPHAYAEDRALYPAVARLMGAPEATATMSRDHIEVGRLTEQLGSLKSQLAATGPTKAQARELRRVLYGLYALVKVHFAKEEEIYLPLLDAHLSADDARQMFEAMEKAAGEVKGHAHQHVHR